MPRPSVVGGKRVSFGGVFIDGSREWIDALYALFSDQQLNSEEGFGLVRIQLAMAWQTNFELCNFWHQDLFAFHAPSWQSHVLI